MAQLSKEAKFKYGDKTVGSVTNRSLSISGNVIEANNFDTGVITQAILGRRTVTISISGQVDREDADGQEAVRTDFLDPTKSRSSDFDGWAIEPETPEGGDTTFAGDCIITNYTEEGADDGDGLETFTAEFRITSITESVAT